MRGAPARDSGRLRDLTKRTHVGKEEGDLATDTHGYTPKGRFVTMAGFGGAGRDCGVLWWLRGGFGI